MDNSTAVAYINKKGGTHSVLCDALAVKIWQWAIPRNIWLSAAFIPGESNVVADFYYNSNLLPYQKLTRVLQRIPNSPFKGHRFSHE